MTDVKDSDKIPYEDAVSDEVEKRCNDLTDESYDEWLDEISEPYELGYSTFYPSDVLKNCDPTAYRCGFGDYQESMRESIEDDVINEVDEDDYNDGNRWDE